MAWRDEKATSGLRGRIDDVIKSSGYRIGPFEVENAPMTHPAVVECAITGVPDPIRGMVVKATVVLKDEYKEYGRSRPHQEAAGSCEARDCLFINILASSNS